MRRLAQAGAAMVLWLATAGIAEAQPAGSGPHFDPQDFFAGRTRSMGVILKVDGELENRISGETRGRRTRDGSTVFDQTIRYDDGKVMKRRWRIIRTGPGTIEATATDIVGTARGTVDGDELHLAYVLRTDPKNPLLDVNFDQMLTLQPDGRTVVNHATVSKFGLPVRSVDEVFRRR